MYGVYFVVLTLDHSRADVCCLEDASIGYGVLFSSLLPKSWSSLLVAR